MTTSRNHAVVLGGSIAGLLAARVLSDTFEKVTLVERDALPHVHGHRKGAPQSLHVHSLMSSGSEALQRLFPRLWEDLLARGARLGDVGHVRYFLAGHRMPRVSTGRYGLCLSRPLLEGYLRERVREIRNVTVMDACDVRGLVGTTDAISGVRLVRRDRVATREAELASDLVVDATGRGSKLSGWLESLGAEAPREERVRLDLTYSSCVYRGTPASLGGTHGIVIDSVPGNPRSGVAMALEDERIMITLTSAAPQGPLDYLGMVDFAKRLAVPDLYDVIRKSEPLSGPAAGRFPQILRRRYELLKQPPSGVLALGDSLCSFSPILAQGMSVAALEAERLDRCLRQSRPGELARAYFAAAARIVEDPWRMSTTGVRLDATEKPRASLPTRCTRVYMAHLMRAAAREANVARSFLEVAQLQKTASALFTPAVIGRVLWAQRPRRAPRAAHTPEATSLVPDARSRVLEAES